MATFRKIHVQFWSDPYIQSLSPEKKYFFLYLLTNEKTKQCGIYEITTRQISYDTGYTVETVLILLQYFADTDKIMFSRDTNELAIKNWNKYNFSRSPDVKNLVNKELTSVKNGKLIEWLQSGNTVSPLTEKSSRGEREEEEEREREKEGVKLPIIQKMLNYWLQNNPSYREIEFDKKAIREIAVFIAGRNGIEHLSDKESSDLMETWSKWCFFILQSDKIKTFSLEKLNRFYKVEIHQSLQGVVSSPKKKMVD